MTHTPPDGERHPKTTVSAAERVLHLIEQSRRQAMNADASRLQAPVLA
jgi:hypothetical protein